MAHVPARTCVACRQTRAKHELVRVVRRSDGRVVVDPSYREQGRGAYVCRTAECIAHAPSNLGRVLRSHIDKVGMEKQLTGVAGTA